jgi:predicted PurR-regulated permease PerM
MANSINDPARAAQVSWLLAAAALLAILKLHLLSAVFAGLLVYELVQSLAPFLKRRLFTERSRLAAVVVLSVLIIGLLSAAIVGALAFFRSDAGSLTALLQRMADIIDGARGSLPAWVVESLPADADELRIAIAQWLRENSPKLQLWGATAGRVAFHVVIGMIVGAMLAMREAAAEPLGGPLARALEERAYRFGEAFRQVVFAQVRIAAINAAFTAIYLAVLLPAFGVKLPFTATLVVITFVAGLLPVIGNVISNSVIVVLSLAHSPTLALVSLAFLVTIHKLEYFLNARIIGTRIHAHAWELLLAILVMEAAFGIAGAVAAPVYYAYVKKELVDEGLI